MPSLAAIFFLSCCFVSLHACHGRILRAKDFDHEQGLGHVSLMGSMKSTLHKSEAASSLKTLSVNTAEHPPPSLQQRITYGNARGCENEEIENPKAEGRRLKEQNNAAAQEIDSNHSNDVVEDVVVMDYAQPHRKPPIHNEEN
uniref:Uncharacterized protein n=1 Tax=Kalanchoe fedtschenkoi TaxID=63787 RepID=A0A7N0U029_KALFE